MHALNGHCDPRFARVQEALSKSIDSGKEIGASLYVNIDGEDVIDLWGGWHDKAHSTLWREDTVVAVFSATKTVTSLAVLMLVDRGEIDLCAPVGRYSARVRLQRQGAGRGPPPHQPHRGPAGLGPAVRHGGRDGHETSTARLAAQAPWWEPGTRGSYHASSFGHLCSELVRRVTGRPAAFIADEITGPIGSDFILGVSEQDQGRVETISARPRSLHAWAPPRPAPPRTAMLSAWSGPSRPGRGWGPSRARSADPLVLFNSPEWRRGVRWQQRPRECARARPGPVHAVPGRRGLHGPPAALAADHRADTPGAVPGHRCVLHEAHPLGHRLRPGAAAVQGERAPALPADRGRAPATGTAAAGPCRSPTWNGASPTPTR